MKGFKRKLALVLTVCMVLNTVIPAYADEIAAPEEPVMQQEVSDIEVSEIINDSEPEETASDGISYEDETILEDIEQATPANADYIETEEEEDDTDADVLEEATPANAEYTDEKFIRETVVDGIKITLIADVGVFPEDAELWAEKVEDEATEEAIEEAVEKERDNNVNVALSYKFDIKMFLNGEEVQPDTTKGTVKVTFTLEEELSECLDANAYHLKEEADGELTAENLGAEVKIAEESSESVKPAVFDEEGVLEDGVIEDDVTKKVTKLEAETDGFSYYVVEFTYNELRYVLPGNSSIKLSEMLDALKISGEVTAAEVSNDTLFAVKKDEEGDDWTITALKAFSSREWFKVTVDGTVYEITVTDEQEPVSYLDIWYDESENTLKKETKSVSEYVVLSLDTHGLLELKAGTWYVVQGEVSCTVRIDNLGTPDSPTRLILTDGCNLNLAKGISNPEGHELIIYAQTENIGNAGTLTVSEPNDGDAGIGGDAAYVEGHAGGNGGKLTINGGIIQVTGGAGAAGIGGGCGYNGKDFAGGRGGNGGTVIINGGKVTAIGGSRLITDIIGQGGAGIGGGSGGNAPLENPDLVLDLAGGRGGDGGTVTVNGGDVRAEGAEIDGAGIGGGGGGIGGSSIGPRTGNGGDGGDGGTVTVNGGTVYAKGRRNGGAGIGGGCGERAGIRFADDTEIGDAGISGNGAAVTILGGTVEAESDYAAAIGSGKDGKNHGALTVDENKLELFVKDSKGNKRYISLADYNSARSGYVLIENAAEIISFDVPNDVYVQYGTSIEDAVKVLPSETTAQTKNYSQSVVLAKLTYSDDIADIIREKYDPEQSYDGTLDLPITLTGTASGWTEEIRKTCSTEVPVTLHIVTESKYTAVPCADKESGDYHENLSVSLDLDKRASGTEYYYTKGYVKNGRVTPSADSAPYNVGDTIDFTEESPDIQYLSAIAYKEGISSGIVTWYYTIRYPRTVKVNNGNGSGTYYLNDTVTVSAGEPEAGKIFDHWTVDKGDISINPLQEVISFTMPAEDVEVTACYADAPLTYTVRFDMGGHGDQVPAQTVAEGGKAVKPEDPKESGYVFQGWYADSIFLNAFDFSEAVTSDRTAYAKWEKTSNPPRRNSSNSSTRLFTGTWGNPVTGTWTQDSRGVWHFMTTEPFKATWGYIVNPYADEGQNEADWFWFDDKGNMMTGWQYINGKWYYLNPIKNSGTYGACFLGPGRTPDGYEIDAAGVWTGR